MENGYDKLINEIESSQDLSEDQKQDAVRRLRENEKLKAIGYPYLEPRYDEKGAFIVPTVDESLYWRYAAGIITLKDAAREFNSHGWTPYVDEDYTRRKFYTLNQKWEKLSAVLQPVTNVQQLIDFKKDTGIQLEVKDGRPYYGSALDLEGTQARYLPDNLVVDGYLNLYNSQIETLPENLTVKGNLDLSSSFIESLPSTLSAESIYAAYSSLKVLPSDSTISGINLFGSEIESLPDNLTVNGSLNLSRTAIRTLPENLEVNGLLDLRDTKIESLPETLKVKEAIYMADGTCVENDKARRTPDDFIDLRASGIPEDRISSSPADQQDIPAQGLIGYSTKDVLEMVREHFNSVLEYSDIDAEIVDMRVIGSRANGHASKESDLDVLLEYEGDYPEDGLFNLLNDEDQRLVIDGIPVDINPITEGKSGTIAQWLERNKDYLKEDIISLLGDKNSYTFPEPVLIYIDKGIARDYVAGIEVKDNNDISLDCLRIDESGASATHELSSNEYEQSDLDKVLYALRDIQGKEIVTVYDDAERVSVKAAGSLDVAEYERLHGWTHDEPALFWNNTEIEVFFYDSDRNSVESLAGSWGIDAYENRNGFFLLKAGEYEEAERQLEEHDREMEVEEQAAILSKNSGSISDPETNTRKYNPGIIEGDKLDPTEKLKVPKEMVNSPLVQQYTDFKKAMPNLVPFFHMSSGYETYQEDAVRVSKVLNLPVQESATHLDSEGNPTKFLIIPNNASDTVNSFLMDKLIQNRIPFAILEDMSKVRSAEKSVSDAVVGTNDRRLANEQENETSRGFHR